MTGNTAHPVGRLLRLVAFFLGGAMVVYLVQVGANPPAKRAAVACFAPYKLTSLAIVTVPHWIYPTRASLQVEGAFRARRFYESCVGVVQKVPGFREGTTLLPPLHSRQPVSQRTQPALTVSNRSSS